MVKLDEENKKLKKIAKIEPDGFEDVYDIEVDQYHNFALANGVVVHNSQWGAKPSHFFVPEKFKVLVGNVNVGSKILTSKEDEELYSSYDDVQIIDVPMDFYNDFEKDVDAAIRDLAGISTVAITPFIRNREKILKAIDETYKHPFTMETWDMSEKGKFIMDELFSYNSLGERVPRIHPGASRHVHIDASIRGDATGFCMGHIYGYKDIITRISDKLMVEKRPMIWIDLALRIKPPLGEDIIFADLRKMVYALSQMGMPIRFVSMDSYQSFDSIQAFQAKGYQAEIISVDKPMKAYDTLKGALYDERLKYYKYPILQDELKRLEFSVMKQKVDHPQDGCFIGDTRIALLDGSCPTFEELFQKYGLDGTFDVYSMAEDGVTVGKGRNPRITKKAFQLVEIMLDNFQVIKCTPDHLFMTLDGVWVQAQNLTKDISLMPLYRTRTNRGGWADYEKFWCPIKNQRFLTHKMVAKDCIKNYDSHLVVHHKNGNKGDNSISNLELLSKEEHASYHTAKRHREDKEWVAKLRSAHEIYRLNGGNEKSRINMIELQNKGILKKGRQKCSIENCEELSNAKGLCGKHYQFYRRVKKKAERSNRKNHRVLSIKIINEERDVWDITVDRYHNFALASGIFVHNSKNCADGLNGVVFSKSMRDAGEPLTIHIGGAESRIESNSLMGDTHFGF